MLLNLSHWAFNLFSHVSSTNSRCGRCDTFWSKRRASELFPFLCCLFNSHLVSKGLQSSYCDLLCPNPFLPSSLLHKKCFLSNLSPSVAPSLWPLLELSACSSTNSHSHCQICSVILLSFNSSRCQALISLFRQMIDWISGRLWVVWNDQSY